MIRQALIPTLCAMLMAGPVRAQPAPTAEAAERLQEQPISDSRGPDVVPLKKGAPAPYSGVLVPGDYFAELLKADVAREDAEARLRVEQKFGASLETMYNTKLVQATKPPPFYKSSSFNRWLGFTGGVMVTILAVYGGSKLIQEAD